jgi:CRP-like cAMP-binding protein/chromosome segregation ATPase
MTSVKDNDDIKLIRQLIPLATLSESRFKELCDSVLVEKGKKGTVLFQQGDKAKEFVYLLSGSVSLQAGGAEMDRVEGGSETARFALAHQLPRKVSAIARTAVRFVRVDSDFVNRPEKQSSNHKDGYQVSDIPEESGDDWMTTMLQSRIFQKIPAANLQKVMISLEEVRLKKGELVVKQGDEGDYYYIIKSGRCSVMRQPSPGAKLIKLGELGTSKDFGEDALISGDKRSVTVAMMCTGSVLRLSKKDFLKLVKEPIVRFSDFKNASQMVKDEGALLLDVRTPELYEKRQIAGSQNLPFFSFRSKINKLNSDQKLIVICDDGKLAEAAAFFLIRFGFDALVLKGGLDTVPEEELGAVNSAAITAIVDEVADPVPIEAAQLEPEVDQQEKGGNDGEIQLLLKEEKAARAKSEQALAILRCDLQAELEKKQKLKKEKQETEALCEEKAKQLESLEKEHETLLAQEPELEKKLGELESNIEQLEEESSKKSRELDGLHKALLEREEAIEADSEENLSQTTELKRELLDSREKLAVATKEKDEQLALLRAELETEVSEKAAVTAAFEREESSLKCKLIELEEALEAAKEQESGSLKSASEKEIASAEEKKRLETELEAQKSELEEVKRIKGELDQQLHTIEKTEQEQKELLERQKEELEAAGENAKEASELQKELADKSSDLEMMQQSLHAAQEELESLSSLKDEQAKGLAQTEEKLKEVEATLESERAEKDKLASNLENSEVEVSQQLTELRLELENAKQSAQESLAEGDKKLEQGELARNELMQRLSEKRSELEASSVEKSSLENENSQLKTELESVKLGQQSELDKLHETQEELEKNYLVVKEELQAEITSLKEEAESRQSQLSEENSRLEAAIQEANDNYDLLVGEHKSLQQNCTDNEGALQRFKEDAEKEHDTLTSRYQEELERAEQKYTELVAEKGLLTEALENARTERLGESDANSVLVEEKQKLEEKIEGLTEENSRLKPFESESVMLSERLVGVEKELESVKAEISSKDAALLETNKLEEKLKELEESASLNEEEAKQKELDYQSRIKELDEQISESELLSEQLAESQKLAESREEELRFNESTYADKLSEFDGDRAKLKDDIASLRAEADELSIRLEEKSKALTEQEEKSFALRKEGAVLERRMQEINEGNGDLWPDDREVISMREEITRISDEKERALEEKVLLSGQIDSLVEQNEELKSVVQEFVAASESQQDSDEDIDSLRTELKMVREQASSDVNAMNEQLKEAQSKVAELEKLLEEAGQEETPSLLDGVTAADADVFSIIEQQQRAAPIQSAMTNEGAEPRRKGNLWPIFAAILILGAVGAAGFLTDQGRVLLGLSEKAEAPEKNREDTEERLDKDAVITKKSAIKRQSGGEKFGSLLETVEPSSVEMGVTKEKAVSSDDNDKIDEDEEILLDEEGDELF